MPRESFKAKNDRRLRLVFKKHEQGLSVEESAELEEMDREVGEYMARKYPRDRTILDDFSAYVRSLKVKVESRRQEPH